MFQKHTFCTVAALLVLALLPKGSLLYEEGANFIDGDIRKYLIEDSPDGFIMIPDNFDTGDVSKDVALEIKCPFPNDYALPVHYSVPVYCAMQLLIHMKAKDVKKAWYVSHSEQSTVLLEVAFDENLWQQVFTLIKQQYDQVDIKVHKNKVKHRDELKVILQVYLDNNTRLVIEVPSICLNEDHRNLITDDGPYYIPNAPKLRNINKLSICTKLKTICRSTYDIIQEAYEL